MTTKVQALQELFEYLNQNQMTPRRQRWHNFSGNLLAHAIIVDINSIEDLAKLMRSVKEKNQALVKSAQSVICVRAAAGWHNDEQAQTQCWETSNARWRNQQTQRYNESYSITPPAAEGDVIVRFSEAFQVKYYQQKGTSVTVPAGLQIGTLALRMSQSAQPLSLPTSSMIWAVSAVGLAANSGHGTGRNQPGFAGLIKSMLLMDDEGNLVIVKKNSIQRCRLNSEGKIEKMGIEEVFPYSDVIMHAHMGMFGIVLNIEIEAEPAFNLKEKRYTHVSFDGLIKSVPLDEHFQKEYSTFMWMPGPGITPRFEFRHWERTNEKSQMEHAVFEPRRVSREQEINIQLNKVSNELIYNRQMYGLMPLVQAIGPKIAIGLQTHTKDNPAIRVGHELDITHYQVSFPNDLMDISMLFPVKDKDVTAFFHWLVKMTDSILKQDEFKDRCPISYAVYARYLKGNGGGLSPLRTENDEHILAFEWVTHPKSPGLASFLQKLFTEISKNPYVQPRFHLGKFVPYTADFRTFLGKDAVDETRFALKEYYGDDERLNNSPFFTPYLISKFKGNSPQLLPLTLTEVEAALAPYQKHNSPSEELTPALLTRFNACLKVLSSMNIIQLTEDEIRSYQKFGVKDPDKKACLLM